MSKKEITWIGLLKEKMALKGKGTSIGDVAPEAKKEWVMIKEGKHPKYTQGKQSKQGKKTKKNSKLTKQNKKGKKSMKNKKMKGGENIEEAYTGADTSLNTGAYTGGTNSKSLKNLLSGCKLCTKCNAEIKRAMKKKQKGGNCGGSTTDADNLAQMTGGECSSCNMTGGDCGCGQ
jgi:hypothetical protein